MLKLVIPSISLAIAVILLGSAFSFHFSPFSPVEQLPTLTGDHRASIRVDLFAEGLSHPTSMAFVDNSTLLVLEKDTGSIRKISNQVLEKEPVLQVNVDDTAERGLLGIAVLREDKQERREINATSGDDYRISKATLNTGSSVISSYSNFSIFIYFTQKDEDTMAVGGIGINDFSTNHNFSTSSNSNNNGSGARNVIYKYDWDGISLTNPKLLVDLRAEPGPYHNGGKMKIGPDDQLYAVIGDLTSPNTILQNHLKQVDDNGNNNKQTPVLMNTSAVILRINPYNGQPSPDNPFAKNYSNDEMVVEGVIGRELDMNYYYAYGIRNSFGLAFDPITDRLWDTENGEDEYDEINLINPGFNSGWHKIMGPTYRDANFSESELTMFKGAHYSDPVFSWKNSIGVTDIEFFNSAQLGKEYSNNLFVGDINNGNLYFFKVNDNRTSLNFEDIPGITNDLIADNQDEVDAMALATGFGGITEIETGPDGNLYILSYQDGRIYRLTNASK